MSKSLTLTQQNRNTLAVVLEQEKDYVSSVIPVEKVSDFKNNYLELANNAYLIEKIPTKEILQTAVNATALGININPIYKECYILPFNTKGKGMVASIVISKDGMAQIYFNAGFLFKMDRVWSLNGKVQKESDMSYEELMLLKPTSHQFVLENLVGWEVSLEDISTNDVKIPIQSTFVSLEYAKEVTKQLQTPEHSIQTYEHKVARRADRDFFIPRFRKSLMLEKVEDYNNSKDDTEDDAVNTTIVDAPTQTVDLKKSTSTETEAIEADIEETVVTVQNVMDYYLEAEAEKKVLIQGVMGNNPDWRTYDSTKLIELLEQIKGL